MEDGKEEQRSRKSRWNNNSGDRKERSGRISDRRALGIPTIEDRIVQAAAKLVIEPIFEADFKECSYGFRPKRSPEDARKTIYKWLNFGCENVIDADITAYFDNIPHENLMKEIERRIADGWVLKLIRAWLRAGALELGILKKTEQGTPQGGVISPLLANIYLNILDREWEASGMPKKYNAKLVRYADDLVILTSQSADKPLQKLKEVIEELGLQLRDFLISSGRG